MNIPLQSLLAYTNGELIVPREEKGSISGVSIDSRDIKKGSLFVCIKGSNVDGHMFADDAIDKGAVALLAERNPFHDVPHVPVIIVQDTVKALGALANAIRNTVDSKVIGITGTAGKTTCKELLSSILECVGPVAKNYLNYNTQVGLPVSILSAKGDEKFWVMEVGISQPHDMQELGAILEPNGAVILNASFGHTAGLGAKGVAHHKAQLLSYIKKDGFALVNSDYPDLVREAKALLPDPVFFSVCNNKAPYNGRYIKNVGAKKSIYEIDLWGKCVQVEVPFIGPIGLESVVAAAATAHMLGVAQENIVQGIEKMMLPKQRCTCFEVGPWVCIDDSYNANPLSMHKIVESVHELAKNTKPLVYVFGDMLELGVYAEEEHEKIGYRMGQTNPQIVFWKGDYIDSVSAGLRRGGYKNQVYALASCKDLQKGLAQSKLDEGIIVFKGSRSNKMEQYVTFFLDYVREKARVI